MKRTPWTDQENRALVALYFTMLDHATTGRPYSKAAMIREAQTGSYIKMPCSGIGPLADRSRGSIEFKLMNASAAHAAVDPEAVTMDGYGYRAMPNYQAGLKDAMRRIVELREINTNEISATGGHYAG